MIKNSIELCLSVDAIVRHEGFSSLEMKILNHDELTISSFIERIPTFVCSSYEDVRLETCDLLIRRYDDIHPCITTELIHTLLVYCKEGKLQQDILYPIGKVISCYSLRQTSVSSVLLNPLLSLFQSLVPNVDVLTDSLQIIATPSSSLIVFEQFLLYIAGNKQYTSYTSSFLEWYLCMPQYSPQFIEKLLMEQSFLYRPTASLLRVVLQSKAIHENPHLTHSVLRFIIASLQSNDDLFHIIDLISQENLTKHLAVDIHIWFLLCSVGLTAMSQIELVMKKVGRFMYMIMKLLITNELECDDRIHRCLRCVFSRCNENAMKDLLSVKITHYSFEEDSLLAQCIQNLDNDESTMRMLQNASISPELSLVYLFSNQESIIQSILSTPNLSNHAIFSVFLASLQYHWNHPSILCHLLRHLPHLYSSPILTNTLASLLLPLIPLSASISPLLIEIMTNCLLLQSSFDKPFWIAIRSCIRLYPSSSIVHIALLTSFSRLTEEGKLYLDELLPLLAHFIRIYLEVKPSSPESQQCRLLLIDCLCEYVSLGYLDSRPLKTLIPKTPSSKEEEEESLKWIETFLPITRCTREMVHLCWNLTSSPHDHISSQAYSLLHSLPSSTLIPLLLEITHSSDSQALIDLCLKRMEGMKITDDRLIPVIQFICLLEEGGSIERTPAVVNTNPTSSNPPKCILTENYWNDENQIFNSYSTILDLIIPLGCYSPNPSNPSIESHYQSCLDNLLTTQPLLNLSSLYSIDLFQFTELALTCVSAFIKRALLVGCSVQSFLSIIRSHISQSSNAGIVYVCLLKIGEFAWEEKKEAIHWLLMECETMKMECLLTCLFVLGDLDLKCEGKNDTSVIDMILAFYLKKWSENLSQQNSGLFLALITGSTRFLQNVAVIPFLLSSETQKGMKRLSQLILQPFVVLFDKVNESLVSRSRRVDSSTHYGLNCHAYVHDTEMATISEGGEPTLLHCGLVLNEWMQNQGQKEIGMDLLQIACCFMRSSIQLSLRLVTLNVMKRLIIHADSALRLRMLTFICNSSSYTNLNGMTSIAILSNWILQTLPREIVSSSPLQERIQKILITNETRNREYFGDSNSTDSSMKRFYEKWNNRPPLHCSDELNVVIPIVTHFIQNQYHSLFSPSPSLQPSFCDSLPKVNPLLSLPKDSIPRVFWNHFSKHSSPILLMALTYSLSLCYTPRGDYRELASYLLAQCVSLQQWDLLQQLLTWMKKNVTNSGIVFSNFVRWMNVKEVLGQKLALLLSFQNLPQFGCDDSLDIYQLLMRTLKSLHSQMNEDEWKEVCSASVQSLSVFSEVSEAVLNVILSIADFVPICVIPDLVSSFSSPMISKLSQYYYERHDKERCKTCIICMKEGILEFGKIFAECTTNANDWLLYSHSIQAYLNDTDVLKTDPCTTLSRIFSNFSTGVQYHWTIACMYAIGSFLTNSRIMDPIAYQLLMNSQDSSDLISLLVSFLSGLMKTSWDLQPLCMFLTSETAGPLRDIKNKRILLLAHAYLGSLSDYALLSYEDAFFNYYYGFDSYLVS